MMDGVVGCPRQPKPIKLSPRLETPKSETLDTNPGLGRVDNDAALGWKERWVPHPGSNAERGESFPPDPAGVFGGVSTPEILSVPGKGPEWNFCHLKGGYQILKLAGSGRDAALDCDKKLEPPVCSSICLSVVLGSALG